MNAMGAYFVTFCHKYDEKYFCRRIVRSGLLLGEMGVGGVAVAQFIWPTPIEAKGRVNPIEAIGGANLPAMWRNPSETPCGLNCRNPFDTKRPR